MSVNVIRINGGILDANPTYLDRLQKEIEVTKEKLHTDISRKLRRSKAFKQILGMITLVGTIGVTCFQNAYALEPSIEAMAQPESPEQGETKRMPILMFFAERMFHTVVPEGASVSINKEDTFIWDLINYMTTVFFKTEDFFDNTSILHIWKVIWYIVMSFTLFIVGKKGFDLMKAQTLGSTSNQSIPNFIVRLLASMLITYLSLDIASIGIHLSNLSIQVLMNNVTKGLISFDSATSMAQAYSSSFFWLAGYVILFFILGVRYWVRQISLILMGMMTPIASMAWITDGGAMLGTLIKEFTVALTTPIVQAALLGIGTTVMYEVSARSDSYISSILITISTMFLMIMTPEFLRKFTHGTANPISWLLKTGLSVKSMPVRFMKMVK